MRGVEEYLFSTCANQENRGYRKPPHSFYNSEELNVVTPMLSVFTLDSILRKKRARFWASTTAVVLKIQMF